MSINPTYARNLYYSEYDDVHYTGFDYYYMSCQEVLDKCVWTNYGEYLTNTTKYEVLADSNKNLYVNVKKVQNKNTYDIGLTKIKTTLNITDTKSTSTSGRYYRVQRHYGDDYLVVNVPWTSQSKSDFFNDTIHDTNYAKYNNLVYLREDDDEYAEYTYWYEWNNSYSHLVNNSLHYTYTQATKDYVSIYNGYGRGGLFCSATMRAAAYNRYSLRIQIGSVGTIFARKENIDQTKGINQMVNLAFVVPNGSTYTLRWTGALEILVQRWY